MKFSPIFLALSLSALLVSCTETKTPQAPVWAHIPTQTEGNSPVAENTPESTTQEWSKTQTIQYDSPAWNEQMEVSLVLDGKKITQVKIRPMATHPISTKWQNAFAKEIENRVVGKEIGSLSLDAVAGASLTTAAFEQYVKQL